MGLLQTSVLLTKKYYFQKFFVIKASLSWHTFLVHICMCILNSWMEVFDFQNYTLAPDSEFPYADRETTCKTNLFWVLFNYCCRLSSIPFVDRCKSMILDLNEPQRPSYQMITKIQKKAIWTVQKEPGKKRPCMPASKVVPNFHSDTSPLHIDIFYQREDGERVWESERRMERGKKE